MKHNEYKQMIQLSLYGDLSKEQQNILESHLFSCNECMQELEHQKNLLTILSEHKKPIVTDQFLNEARAQLRGALSIQNVKKVTFNSFKEKILSFVSTPPKLALGAVSLLVVGFFLGKKSKDF